MRLIELEYPKNLETKIIFDGEFDSLSFIDNIDNKKKEPEKKGFLTYATNEKYLDYLLANNNFSCVILPYSIEISKYDLSGKGIILSENPKFCFFSIHNFLATETTFYKKKSAETCIDSTSKIGSYTSISDINVFINKNCEIGHNTIVYNDVIINQNSVIHSNCIIGSQGFYTAINKNYILNVVHAGSVIIGKNVNIQSGSIIDKEVLGNSTVICDNVVIGGMVHIGHGVQIGENTCISTGSIIGGYTKIGENVYIGPGVVISNRIIVNDNAFISLGSVVFRNVKRGQRVSGNFAIDHNKYLDHIYKINRKS